MKEKKLAGPELFRTLLNEALGSQASNPLQDRAAHQSRLDKRLDQVTLAGASPARSVDAESVPHLVGASHGPRDARQGAFIPPATLCDSVDAPPFASRPHRIADMDSSLGANHRELAPALRAVPSSGTGALDEPRTPPRASPASSTDGMDELPRYRLHLELEDSSVRSLPALASLRVQSLASSTSPELALKDAPDAVAPAAPAERPRGSTSQSLAPTHPVIVKLARRPKVRPEARARARKLYLQAVEQLARNNRLDAIGHIKRAIEIDDGALRYQDFLQELTSAVPEEITDASRLRRARRCDSTICE